MTLVFPRCILRPTGLLVSWMSCIIFCSSEVDLAISTMSSAKMRWDRYSPSILIPLSFQLILPMIASCRHDVKSLGEMLSPCHTPLCSLKFLTICVDRLQMLPHGTGALLYHGKPCQLHGS